ncbi:hypothetical protein, partial [Thermoactinomyces sp. CICC 10522]|uniref:hypothetical protein n=1 Tax=Thermoactinomyces sp. CICC 10522 TaxID=2767427 RepID=UPI001E5A6478
KLSDKDLAQKELTGHASLFSFQGTLSVAAVFITTTIYILSHRCHACQQLFLFCSLAFCKMLSYQRRK